jgi:hypothetical protein
MAEIIIKNGDNFLLKVDRTELVQVDETPDGVVFQFKNGLSLMKNDQFMPSGIKQIMKNTADNYPDKKLVYDLNNPKRPVYVDAT